MGRGVGAGGDGKLAAAATAVSQRPCELNWIPVETGMSYPQTVTLERRHLVFTVRIQMKSQMQLPAVSMAHGFGPFTLTGALLIVAPAHALGAPVISVKQDADRFELLKKQTQECSDAGQ